MSDRETAHRANADGFEGQRLHIEQNVRTQAQHLRIRPASAAASNRRAR